MRKFGFTIVLTALLEDSEVARFQTDVKRMLESMKIDAVKVLFLSNVEDLEVNIEEK